MADTGFTVPTDTQILAVLLAILGYILVAAILNTLAHRIRHRTQRHQTIIEARKLRLEHDKAVADRREAQRVKRV